MVKEALEELEGVEKVENERDRDPEAIDLDDLLFVTYDPDAVTLEQVQALISEHGFESAVQ